MSNALVFKRNPRPGPKDGDRNGEVLCHIKGTGGLYTMRHWKSMRDTKQDFTWASVKDLNPEPEPQPPTPHV